MKIQLNDQGQVVLLPDLTVANSEDSTCCCDTPQDSCCKCDGTCEGMTEAECTALFESGSGFTHYHRGFPCDPLHEGNPYYPCCDIPVTLITIEGTVAGSISADESDCPDTSISCSFSKTWQSCGPPVDFSSQALCIDGEMNLVHEEDIGEPPNCVSCDIDFCVDPLGEQCGSGFIRGTVRIETHPVKRVTGSLRAALGCAYGSFCGVDHDFSDSAEYEVSPVGGYSFAETITGDGYSFTGEINVTIA